MSISISSCAKHQRKRILWQKRRGCKKSVFQVVLCKVIYGSFGWKGFYISTVLFTNTCKTHKQGVHNIQNNSKSNRSNFGSDFRCADNTCKWNMYNMKWNYIIFMSSMTCTIFIGSTTSSLKSTLKKLLHLQASETMSQGNKFIEWIAK